MLEVKKISPQDYVKYLNEKRIPPYPPKGTVLHGSFDYLTERKNVDAELYNNGSLINSWHLKEECNKLGMWALVDKVWTKTVADWVGDCKVLEIMSGGGWIAKALSEHGINIMATDDYSWDDRQKMAYAYPVQKIEAVEAVKTIPADILLVSWPPYGDTEVMKACEEWGSERPIIYVGEYGGCCATEKFFDYFKPMKPMPEIPFWSWCGLHDDVFIGYWHNPKRKILWKRG